MSVCVCQQVPKQPVVSQHKIIYKLWNLVCSSKVAATLRLTLLEAANTCQTCTSNVCVWERMKTFKWMKTSTHGAKIPSTSMPSPHSSPLLGSQGLQQPGCLPEGQSHSGPAVAAVLWCLCAVTLRLMSTLINFVNDRSMWASRRVRCRKIIAYLPFQVCVPALASLRTNTQ